MPQISVIVPVYNVEPYLRQCVDSILNQTFTDFELLLVDDGSTDRSGAICDEYASLDARVKVFHTTNRGVSAARNLGIDKASAEWITFVDSDDWVEKSYLANFEKYSKDKNLILLQGYTMDYSFQENKQIGYYPKEGLYSLIGSQNDLFIVLTTSMSTCGKLYNMDVIRKNAIKYVQDISINEDRIFNWTYLCYIQNVRIISTCAYHWNIRNQTSLCWKFHPSEEYIRGFEMQCSNLSFLQNRLSISNEQLLKDVYANLVQWLIVACRNVTEMNYKTVFEYVRSQKGLLNKYYVPHSFLKHIFKYSFTYSFLSNQTLYFLIRTMRSYLRFIHGNRRDHELK